MVANPWFVKFGGIPPFQCFLFGISYVCDRLIMVRYPVALKDPTNLLKILALIELRGSWVDPAPAASNQSITGES